MSVVTGVTLHMCCHEHRGDHDRDVPVMAEINAWLKAGGFDPLVSVEDHYCGGKHPQALVYGGGYAWLDDANFSNFVIGRDWHCPSSVVLILNVEEYGAKVYRPDKLGDWNQGIDAALGVVRDRLESPDIHPGMVTTSQPYEDLHELESAIERLKI